MAWIGSYTSEKTGFITWRVQFRRPTYEGKEVFSAQFISKEEAQEFCKKWEDHYYLYGKKGIEYDRHAETRRRKYYHIKKRNDLTFKRKESS